MKHYARLSRIVLLFMGGLFFGCESKPAITLDKSPPDPAGTPRIRAGATRNGWDQIPQNPDSKEKGNRR
jgi:hypothetical protein